MHAHFGAQPFVEWQHRDARHVLTLFLASALFVLLIALVNLTNLMLLRALSRNHDAAVRSALGAPRLRLALPALGEGLLVGMSAALLGMVLAWLGLARIARQRAGRMAGRAQPAISASARMACLAC